MKTKWIKQRRSNDCGIVALAMLFDMSYTDMNKLVRAQAAARDEPFDGTPHYYSRGVGHLLGDPVRVWLVGEGNRTECTQKLIGRPAVLVVPAKGFPGEYHALYWDGKLIYDPMGIDPPWHYGRKGILAFKVYEEAWVLDSDG